VENKKNEQDVASQGNTNAGSAGSRVASDVAEILVVALQPEQKIADYFRAKQLADGEAAKRLSEFMLMSWYDRDRDFESPHSAGECHEACPTPGYVDYGLNHGATLKVDVENGRFVFFYAPVQW